MGIFNEQSLDHPFARGIQGAPGVGFNLTSSGDYDMINKKLRNVGAPSDNNDAATKKYVDDNSSGSVDTSEFLKLDGTRKMTGNLDMNNNRIYNIPAPNGPKQPTPLAFTDLKYLHVTGTNSMANNLNMNNKKINHLALPTSLNDAANKKYVDDTLLLNNVAMSNYLKKDGTVAMTGNLNINNNKIVSLATPTNNTDASTKKYVDDTVAANKVDDSLFFKSDGSKKMTGNIDMNNNRILNLPMPNGNNQPTTLIYANSNYLRINGIIPMFGDLNMNSNKIKNVKTPTDNSDAATKKYVDDNSGSPDLSDYLEKDGSVAMTGELNGGGNKIINIGKPLQNSDAATKDYVDKLVHHTAVQPSHYNNQFAYLMSSGAQWTDEIDGGVSFVINKIGDLSPSKGNFHDYNHKVIYMTIVKNLEGKYKYKMGINFYRLTANTDYTLCLEILNTDYNLWNNSQISVDKGTSTGLSIGNVGIRKLSHRYTDSTGKTQTMYYHRIIVNFRKLSSGNKFFLHILVDILRGGYNLNTYPRQFLGVYMIAYGIMGTFSNIDPDKVYDYHTAFDIKPTEVKYNVDINTNNKKILNIALDRNSNNSAATVAMVNELVDYTTNIVYRKYFSEFFDFTDANSYVLNKQASGVVFNALSSVTGNSARNLTFPNKTVDIIKKDGLNVNGYTLYYSSATGQTSYTLCLVFTHWRNRNFSITKKDINNNQTLFYLYYLNVNDTLNIHISNTRKTISIPSSLNGKKVVLWITESISASTTKVNISNYSAELVCPVVSYSANQKFEFLNQDGVIEKFMYSPNFYDTGSVEFHKIFLQEKLNGSYIM